MRNRRILPSRCSPITYPSLRPCLALHPSLYKPKRSSAALNTHERVPVDLSRQRKRLASLRARIRSTYNWNESTQGKTNVLLVDQSTPVSDSKSTANLYCTWKRRKIGASPTLPQIVLPRKKNRRTRAQSRLPSHVRAQQVKSGLPWRLSQKISGRREGGVWLRRLDQIAKPSRSKGPYRMIKRTHYVSFGLWPKHTSWSSPQSTTDTLEEITWDWTSNFRTLRVPEEMQGWTRLDTKQVIRYFLGLRSGRNRANKEWTGLQGYDDASLWQNVMLWCLKYRRKQALMLLFATFKGRKYRPPRYVVLNCLAFLARHFLFEVSNPNPSSVDAIWLLTCKTIDGAGHQQQSFPVSQDLVYLVLQHSDDSRVLSFYDLLGSNKVVLHVNTILKFLDRFLDMGRINLSMRILRTIASTKFDLSWDRIQMACVKLLRARFDAQDEYAVRSNILTQILEMGIRPRVPLMNAILLNAGEGGDFANALQMYRLARENALVPDSITFGVLLKGAKLSGKISNVEMVIRDIQRNKKALQDLRLISDVLNAISLMSPGDSFGAMLDFYRRHCDLRPLQELSLCGDEIQAPPGANCSEIWPTVHILTQMILAYVRLKQGSLGLIYNYNLYYQHVKENHPLIAPLAKSDFVANSFILAFGKNPSTLQHCTTVIKHMLELSSPNHVTSDSTQYAAPGVQTWSILFAAYLRNRQRRAAEKVLDMMRERGIQRDQVSWNTLVSGYAGLQDVDAAVDTVKRMEAVGFETDNYTTKGLGRLWPRGRLEKALERRIRPIHS